MKNNLSSNKITIVIVDMIPEEKEPEVYAIPEIPEEKVEFEKEYYRCVHAIIRLKKEVGVDIKEEQADVEDYTNEEDIGNVNLDDERGDHWRMVFEESYGGVDDGKGGMST